MWVCVMQSDAKRQRHGTEPDLRIHMLTIAQKRHFGHSVATLSMFIYIRLHTFNRYMYVCKGVCIYIYIYLHLYLYDA